MRPIIIMSLLHLVLTLLSSEVLSTLPPEDYTGSAVPGVAGRDYPTFSSVPSTSFSCSNRPPGFYPDPEAGCQVFHVCSQMSHQSFLCPNGTIFNFRVNTCDWWNKVECTESAEETIPTEENIEYNILNSQNQRIFDKNQFPSNQLLNFNHNLRASKAGPNAVALSPSEVSTRSHNKFTNKNEYFSPEMTTPSFPSYPEATEIPEQSQADAQDFINLNKSTPQEYVFPKANDVIITKDTSVGNYQGTTQTQTSDYNLVHHKLNYSQQLKDKDRNFTETGPLTLTANYSFTPGFNNITIIRPLRRRVTHNYAVQDLPNIDNGNITTTNTKLVPKIARLLGNPNNQPKYPINKNDQSKASDKYPPESDITSFDLKSNTTTNRTTISKYSHLPTTKAAINFIENSFPKNELKPTERIDSFSKHAQHESRSEDYMKSSIQPSTNKIKGHYITEAPIEVDPYRTNMRFGIKRNYFMASDYKSTSSNFDDIPTNLENTNANEFSLEDSSYTTKDITNLNFDQSREENGVSTSPLLSAENDARFDLTTSRPYLFGYKLSFENSHVLWPFLSPFLTEIGLSPIDTSTENVPTFQAEIPQSSNTRDDSKYVEAKATKDAQNFTFNPLQQILRNRYAQNDRGMFEDNELSSSSTMDVRSTTESVLVRSNNTHLISSPLTITLDTETATDTYTNLSPLNTSVSSTNPDTDNPNNDQIQLRYMKENSEIHPSVNSREPNIGLNSRDLLDINNLESSTPDESSAEILKSISFSLDLEEDRTNYEIAQAAGLFQR